MFSFIINYPIINGTSELLCDSIVTYAMNAHFTIARALFSGPPLPWE